MFAARDSKSVERARRAARELERPADPADGLEPPRTSAVARTAAEVAAVRQTRRVRPAELHSNGPLLRLPVPLPLSQYSQVFIITCFLISRVSLKKIISQEKLHHSFRKIESDRDGFEIEKLKI